jgi:hypothetical protein
VGHVERVAISNDTGVAGDTIRVPIDDTLKGILITPHLKADPLWFTFNNAGNLVSYLPLNEPDEYWERAALLVDTQAAGIGTHVAICEFLQYIHDNYMPGLHVYDETNYFESGDVLRAERAIDESSASNPFDAAADPSETDAETDPMTPGTESGSLNSETPRRKKSTAARGKHASKSNPSDKRSFPTDN